MVDSEPQHPDGTPLGDARHVLFCQRRLDDDTLVLAGSYDVYGPGETTGLSMGDLRALVKLAELGALVRDACLSIEES